jgi:site-specific recombinase XerD
VIRSFYDYFVDQDDWKIYKNPAKNVQRMKVPKTIPVTLKEEDAETLLDVIYIKSPYAVRDYALFATFIFTALRVSEVINLEISDLDFAKGKILVRQGKGQKDRIVPMIPRLANILKRYLKIGISYTKDGRINKSRSGREYFLTNHENQALFLTKNGERFTEKGVEYIFKKYTKMIGIYRKGLSLHAMRRSCLTFLYRAGVDLFVLKEISGHVRIQTLENYIVVDEEKVMNAAMKHPLADREIDQRLVDLFLSKYN